MMIMKGSRTEPWSKQYECEGNRYKLGCGAVLKLELTDVYVYWNLVNEVCFTCPICKAETPVVRPGGPIQSKDDWLRRNQLKEVG